MKNKFGLFYDDFLKYPVEYRFLVMIPWFASLLTGISTVTALFLRNNVFTVTCSLSTVIFILTYIMIRTGKSLRLSAWIMAMNTLILTNFVWIIFEGSRGTSPVLILMLLVSVSIFFKKTEKIIAILIISINTLILVYIEYLHPEIILPYSGAIARLMDMIITYLVCGIFLVFVIHGILKSYFTEKEKADQVDHLKRAFLLNISHEVRTPLNAIIGFSNLMNQPETNMEEREIYSKFVDDSCKSLVNLIEEIIDVAKIESKQLYISKEPSDVSELVREIYDYFVRTPEKQISRGVQFKMDEGLMSNNVIIETDPNILKRILLNLIDNSIKFTQKGSIEFGFKIRQGDLLFFVKDTGIGMAAEKQKYVFDSFHKLDAENGKLYKGIGLGLTLSKKLIELLNGKIWVNSEVNRGSTFFFTIPYEKIQVSPLG